MNTLSTHDQLAYARAAAAERQRRADEYRTTNELRPGTRVPVPAFVATVTAAVLGFGLGALTGSQPAVAEIVEEPSETVQYDTYTELGSKTIHGLVDGWYEPGTQQPVHRGPTNTYR